jgi:hypothetical protein
VSVFLRPQLEGVCPNCGADCFVGIRAPGVLIINCPDHGVFTIGGSVREDLGQGRMNPEERFWLIDQALKRFLVDPDRGDFMVLQSSTLPCNYVQFRHNYGELWSEVCSREWDCKYCGNRPLSAAARASIGELGYLDGGEFGNYEARRLCGPTNELALLADNAMMRAFDEPFDYELGVYFKRADALRDLIRHLAGPTSERQDLT